MNIWKGLIAGAAASIVATVVDGALRRAAPRTTVDDDSPRCGPELKAVDRATQLVPVDPSDRQKDFLAKAANVVAASIATAVIGKLRREATGGPPTFARGALLGIGTFLLFEEVAKPAVGVYRKPTKASWPVHARRFASHMAYRMTNVGARRLLY